MTRQQRRSKSVYLNACRKLGYRPSKGYCYRKGRWMRRFSFRLVIAKADLGEAVPSPEKMAMIDGLLASVGESHDGAWIVRQEEGAP